MDYKKDEYEECRKIGGFWYSYGIHAQEWISCKDCEDIDCPYEKAVKIKDDEIE